MKVEKTDKEHGGTKAKGGPRERQSAVKSLEGVYSGKMTCSPVITVKAVHRRPGDRVRSYREGRGYRGDSIGVGGRRNEE